MLKELTETEFAARAVQGGIIPVYREYLADMDTPVSVLARIGDRDAFLLESVVPREAPPEVLGPHDAQRPDRLTRRGHGAPGR